jgi:hypothetical protein
MSSVQKGLKEEYKLARLRLTLSAVSVAVSRLASTAKSGRLSGWSLLVAVLNVE